MTAWGTPWIWSTVKHVKIVKEQPFKVSGNASGGIEQMKKLYSRKSTRDFQEKWDSIVFEVGPVLPSDLPAQGGRNSIPDWYNQGHNAPSSPGNSRVCLTGRGRMSIFPIQPPATCNEAKFPDECGQEVWGCWGGGVSLLPWSPHWCGVGSTLRAVLLGCWLLLF